LASSTGGGAVSTLSDGGGDTESILEPNLAVPESILRRPQDGQFLSPGSIFAPQDLHTRISDDIIYQSAFA
ncbi:MAG: hypothetical protein ACXAEF_13045, partial [Candidatus Thorarchaeota archaeon]